MDYFALPVKWLSHLNCEAQKFFEILLIIFFSEVILLGKGPSINEVSSKGEGGGHKMGRRR